MFTFIAVISLKSPDLAHIGVVRKKKLTEEAGDKCLNKEMSFVDCFI